MKKTLIISALCLLVAIAPMPIGYYTFLRILITVSSFLILFSEFKNWINLWIIAFGIIAILLNPIIPIYLYKKSIWMIIDLITAVLFLSYSFKKDR